MKASLELQSIAKTYSGSGSAALRSLSLELYPGEILGLLGPNGAGKTTAISIIAGIVRQDSGKVRLLDASRPDERKKSIALVPQDIALFQKLTARENLTYFGRLCGIGGKVLKNRVDASIEWMRLAEHEAKLVHQLSGGLKRRVNIAVGLINNPPILLLDEPLVGIDAQAKRMIAEQLLSCAASGTAMLYTSHNMDEIQHICHRVCIIDKGVTICVGTPSELLQAHPGCKNLEEIFIKLTGRALRE